MFGAELQWRRPLDPRFDKQWKPGEIGEAILRDPSPMAPAACFLGS